MTPEQTAAVLTDEQIKHMVERFLSWKLPANFQPDAGISFKPIFNEHTTHEGRHHPSGTNLLDYSQAEAMVRHMVEGLALTDTQGEVVEPETYKPTPIYFEDQDALEFVERDSVAVVREMSADWSLILDMTTREPIGFRLNAPRRAFDVGLAAQRPSPSAEGDER